MINNSILKYVEINPFLVALHHFYLASISSPYKSKKSYDPVLEKPVELFVKLKTA